MRKLVLAIVAGCFASLLMVGCDAVSRHKVLTTIFDGVPSLPPAGEFCEQYAQQKIAAIESGGTEAGPEEGISEAGSKHPPFRDKNCDGCHDRSRPSGFVSDRVEDLCYVCHTDFIQGSYVHGPVAARACLFCHDPHASNHSSLLKFGKSEICAECHKERRVAFAMHSTVVSRNMDCVDCHNPHFGEGQYFLQ